MVLASRNEDVLKRVCDEIKAAVKAYSEVLRMEMIHEDAPIKITVLKPSGIATPISDHGRSHMGHRGKVMSPLYDVEIVATAILAAAQRPVRNLTVGETGRLTEIGWAVAPSLFDRVIAWALPRAQGIDKPPVAQDNLFQPGEDGHIYLEGTRSSTSSTYSLSTRIRVTARMGVASAMPIPPNSTPKATRAVSDHAGAT